MEKTCNDVQKAIIQIVLGFSANIWMHLCFSQLKVGVLVEAGVLKVK